MLKHPFTYLTPPVPPAPPLLSQQVRQVNGALPIARTAWPVTCFSVTPDNSFYLPNPQLMVSCQERISAPPFLAAAGLRTFAITSRHRCVGIVGTGHSSESLPAVWSADLATKGSLSRSFTGKHVSTPAFISGRVMSGLRWNCWQPLRAAQGLGPV